MSEHLEVANITVAKQLLPLNRWGNFCEYYGEKKNENEINAVRICNHNEQTYRMQDQSFSERKTQMHQSI